MLKKELARIIEERDTSFAVENDGRTVVPPHLINAKLGNRQHVMIGGGKSFGTWTMTEILALANLIPELKGNALEKLRTEKAALAHLQHTSLVWDVMYRYGEDVTKRKEQHMADIMKLFKVDQYKRTLAMMAEVRKMREMMQGKTVQAVERGSEFYTLSLTIVEAHDLPKMDVLHGIDSYCVVSVDNLQDEVYQTKVVKKNRNPTFDANFEWQVPVDTELLTVAIVDHDTITEDDLVR